MRASLDRCRGLVAAAALAAAFGPAAAAPDLDAVISYRTQQLLADGTTRVDTWKERLVRRADRVATERVLPAAARSAQVEAGHEHDGVTAPIGHRHFDAARTTRVLQREADGRIALSFVDRAHRRVVSVPQAEWSAVGFDGRYDAASHLVPPALVASLPRQAVPAPAGASWRVQRGDGWTHRVLWSDVRQVALRIESRRDDGSVQREVALQPVAAAPASQLPWSGTADFRQMTYDDFMD